MLTEIDTWNCKQRLKYSTEKDKGLRRPIFHIKTDSVRGKIDLPFAVHWFLVSYKGFQEIARPKWPNLEYFQVQKDDASTSWKSFILGANCRYIFNVQKAPRLFRSKYFLKSE